MFKETPNKFAPANRRYASPLGAGRQFARALLAWLPGQAGDDACLLFMIRGAKIVCVMAYDHIIKFPAPSGVVGC
jgi:hypothetical protein